ncbi:MAG TPA: GNAT family N-acetyltransferase [Bryobacteraceae bacterium]|jgi:N-acetylglutamate synthase-like GNAT family acetyltransferase
MDPRPYSSTSDRSACLALLIGGKSAEHDEFARFLDDCDPAAATVLEHDGKIAGFGGWVIDEDGAAELVRAVIRSDLRRMGLGRFLVMYRLRQITQSGREIAFVRARVPAEAAGFYEKQGFKRQPGGMGGSVELVMKMKVCS